MRSSFLRASGLALAGISLGLAALFACGHGNGDDAGSAGGANGDGGVGGEGGGSSSGDPSTEGQPPLPPRTDPVISTDHPRIYLPGNKDRLNAKIAANDRSATRFISIVADQMGGANYYGFDNWPIALLGALTGDAKYCTYAVAQVDKAVASDEALIAAGKEPDVATDSYRYVGDVVADVGTTYDYCYASLTSDQRTRWGAYVDQTMFNLWNPTQAKWGGKSMTWDGWSIDNPYNNYFMEFLRATLVAGLAFNKELPNAAGWVDMFRKTKLGEVFTAYNANMVGGGSREGTGYGESLRMLYESYDFWQGSTTERVWDLTAATRLSLPQFMQITMPTADRLAAIGDQARDSEVDFFDYHRELVLALQHLVGPDDPLAQVAQTYLETVSIKEMQQQYLYYWDFIYADSTHPKLPMTKLTPGFFAPGVGYTTFRSSWDPTATWGLLMGGPYTESHAHHDQGSLLIYKGAWLAFDENVSSKSGIQQDEELHNLVRLVKSNKTVQMQSSDKPAQTVAVGNDANIVSWSGKMQDIYDNPSVSRVERDVVFIRPLETFVVFDRINATVDSAVWQLNSRAAPTQSGSKWTVAPTGGSLDVFPLLPAGASANVVSWNSVASDYAKPSSRLDISGPPNARFLVVLAPGGKVTSASGAPSGANSVATVSFAGGANATVTFSTDGSGGHVTVSGGGISIDQDLASGVTTPSLFAN